MLAVIPRAAGGVSPPGLNRLRGQNLESRRSNFGLKRIRAPAEEVGVRRSAAKRRSSPHRGPPPRAALIPFPGERSACRPSPTDTVRRVSIRRLVPDGSEEFAHLLCENRDFLAPSDPVRDERFITSEGQRESIQAGAARTDRSRATLPADCGGVARVASQRVLEKNGDHLLYERTAD